MNYSSVEEVWGKEWVLPPKKKSKKKNAKKSADPTCELVQRGKVGVKQPPYEDPPTNTHPPTQQDFSPYQLHEDYQVYRLDQDQDDVYLDEAMRAKYRIKPEYDTGKVPETPHWPIPENASWEEMEDSPTPLMDALVPTLRNTDTPKKERHVVSVPASCDTEALEKQIQELVKMVASLQKEVKAVRAAQKQEFRETNYFDYGIFIVAGVLLITMLEQLVQLGFRVSRRY